ncbi:MAG: tetratricopeptide repeat protein [Chloroflexi bacterium]|nr:tetratricopeptide repeat protein [Chloroflexota bacterium]MQC27374.1 tetratricopeptide repeat protein [Chloroflexota bacterium]
MSAESNVKNLKPQLERAWSLRVNHKLGDAETAFSEYLERDPENVHAVYGLAQVMMEQGRDKDAAKQFKQAIKLIDSGVLGDDELRAGLLRRQALGHIERMKTGSWDLVSIGNAIPKD